MTQETKNVITFNGTEFNVDEMSDRAKHIVLQLRILDGELRDASMVAERLEVAKAGYIQELEKELYPEVEEVAQAS